MTTNLTFADAASCLNLTITAMKLEKPEDREFLAKAMKTYADFVIQEARAINAELLEALQLVVRDFTYDNDFRIDGDTIQICRDAIAKATT